MCHSRTSIPLPQKGGELEPLQSKYRRYAGGEVLPDGSESFYNQVIAAHLGWKRTGNSAEDVLTFGNDEAIPEESLNALVSIAREFTVPLAWQNGDVALVDNHRVMHGRHPYSGSRKREVVVCLARDV